MLYYTNVCLLNKQGVTAIMSTVRFIEHKGKQVLFLEYSKVPVDRLVAEIENTKTIIAAQPPGSVLTLTDVTGVESTRESSEAIKSLAKHNKPYVRAGAVVGVSGIRRITFNAVLVVTGRRNLHLFEDIEEAKDWLIQQ